MLGVVQLTFDDEVEAFRAEFIAFLDEHLPPKPKRRRSGRGRRRTCRSGRVAGSDCSSTTAGCCRAIRRSSAAETQRSCEQFVHREELSRRRIYHAFNPQGVGIIAASLLSFGTDEQKQRWAVPILRADMTASLGMSEPGAGSDLAGLSTRAVLDGDHFVVNGQKVWTSGAHDADVLLTFVRTDPDAPKHKGISAVLIPTDSRGGASAVRVACTTATTSTSTRCSSPMWRARREPRRSTQRRLAGGQRFARSRAHDDVDGVRQPVGADARRSSARRRAEPRPIRDAWRWIIRRCDCWVGGVGQAARGERDVAGLSVLKVFGSEAEQNAYRQVLEADGVDGLTIPR